MKPTLQRYISKKLDGVEGEIPRLIHMFKKSFTAPNFRSFWNTWNPIYSYVLTYYVYKPLRGKLPKGLAVVLTFLVNGLFHDFMVLIILRKPGLIVTRLFFIYGVLVMIETLVKIRFSDKKLVRVLYNLVLLILPIVLVIS